VKLREFGYHDRHQSHKVDGEICKIVVCVVRTQEEKDYGYCQKEFLRRRVLVPVVDLFPHVEVVVGSGIELERYASYIVEHQVRTGHICDIGECPRYFLRHAGDNVK